MDATCRTQGPNSVGDVILIVDSNLIDGTAELARSHGARVIFVPDDQFDHSSTWNAALRQATGEFVLFPTQHFMPGDGGHIKQLFSPFAADRIQ